MDTVEYAQIHYILNEDNTLTPAAKIWSEANHKRCRVEHTQVVSLTRRYSVSTVFVGRALTRADNGSPLVFETVVLHDEGITRVPVPSSTWEEAEKEHWRICAAVRDGEFDGLPHRA